MLFLPSVVATYSALYVYKRLPRAPIECVIFIRRVHLMLRVREVKRHIEYHIMPSNPADQVKAQIQKFETTIEQARLEILALESNYANSIQALKDEHVRKLKELEAQQLRELESHQSVQSSIRDVSKKKQEECVKKRKGQVAKLKEVLPALEAGWGDLDGDDEDQENAATAAPTQNFAGANNLPKRTPVNQASNGTFHLDPCMSADADDS